MSAIDHPSHYGGESNVYEAIKVIEAWSLNFCLGNTVKYICRAGKKHKHGVPIDTVKATIEDLEKAEWYLQREIQRLKSSTTDISPSSSTGDPTKGSSNRLV